VIRPQPKKTGFLTAIISTTTTLIRGFIFEGETSRFSHVLNELVFLAGRHRGSNCRAHDSE
jgi:hypothetical protein